MNDDRDAIDSLEIRPSQSADRAGLAEMIAAAFPDEGNVINPLIDNLLADPTAEPRLSLVAILGDRVVGHILFSAVRIAGDDSGTTATILCPLAVHPNDQRQGIGGALIRNGAERLSAAGIDLAFVLGYPYYQRHGFKPAADLGFEATYPPPPEHCDAWMVRELRAGSIGRSQGPVLCAAALDDPLYWVE